MPAGGPCLPVHAGGFVPGAFDDVIAEIRHQAFLAIDGNEYAGPALDAAIDHAAWRLQGRVCAACRDAEAGTTQPALEVRNRFRVAVQGRQLLVMRPPVRPLSPAEALNLAAWLVVLAEVIREPDEPTFDELRAAAGRT